MRTASAALAWVLVPTVLWAAPAAADKNGKDDRAVSPAEKLRADLDRPISLKIDKQSLTAAIDALREKSKINIVLDSLTIQQIGIAPDQPPVPVQVDLKEVKVRAALKAILAPYGLSYAPLGDTIVVTTEDAAMVRQMRQRVSVDLSKVDLAGALRSMGRETGANLVLDSRVEKEAKAEVTLQVDDVPLETAVRLLSEMASLKPVRVGNTLFVTKKEIAAELRNDPDIAAQNPQGVANTIYTLPQGGVPQQFIIGNAVTGPGQTALPNQPAPVLPNPPPLTGSAPAPPGAGPAPSPPGTGTGTTPPPPPDVQKIVDSPKDGEKAPTDKKDDK
jgi:hypothetical protein